MSVLRLSVVALSVSMIGSFQFLYDMMATNGISRQIRQFMNRTLVERYDTELDSASIDSLIGVYMAMQLIGGAAGSLCIAPMADRFGRWRSLMALAILNLIVLVPAFMAFPLDCFELLLAVKPLMGFLSGAGLSLQSTYITEITPTALRGRMNGLIAVTNACSVLLASVLSLRYCLGTDLHWNSLYIVQMVVTVMSLPILCVFGHETAQHILTSNKDKLNAPASAEAARIPQLYDGITSVVSPEPHNPSETASSTVTNATEHVWTGSRSITSKSNRVYIWHALVIGCTSPASGIVVVGFSATVIFDKLHFSYDQSAAVLIAFGVISLICTIVPLLTLDRFGRRFVFISSSIAVIVLTLSETVLMCLLQYTDHVTHATLTLIGSYTLMVVLCAHNFTFYSGSGLLAYFQTCELTPTVFRPTAQSICFTTNLTLASLEMLTFFWLMNVFGVYIFLIFPLSTVLVAVYYYKYIPECKQQTFQQIAEQIQQRWNPQKLEVI